MASYVAYKPTGEVIGIMGKGTLKNEYSAFEWITNECYEFSWIT